MDSLNIASDVVTAGTALAGLILVYLGAQVTAYGSYDTEGQSFVGENFKKKAWIAFLGFVCALLAALLAIVGKWIGNNCLVSDATFILFVAFIFAFVTAIATVMEIG